MLRSVVKTHRYNALKISDQSQLDQNRAVSPQLRKIIRHRIICDDLKPGNSISETGLAKNYNVSRQPVREALIPLVGEGLIEIRPQRGTFVKRINLASLLNGRFIREAVEADMVRMIAQSPDISLITELRLQLQEQRQCPAGSIEKFIRLDEKFHKMLSDAAGMLKVWDFLDVTRSKTDRVRFIAADEYPMQTLIEQHQQIVDSIDEAKPEQAQSSMRNHLRDILATLPRILKLYPEYFDDAKILGEAYSVEEPREPAR